MKFGLGHNAATLTAFVPQPRYAGLLFARTRYTPSGMVQDAPYAELVWSALTPDEMDTLMKALDLVSNSARDVTVALPGDDRETYKSYNGTAMRPTKDYLNPLHRDVTVIVRDLVEI